MLTLPVICNCNLLCIAVTCLVGLSHYVNCAVDSKLRSPGFETWLGHCVLSLSTQEYKWVLANCQGSLMKC